MTRDEHLYTIAGEEGVEIAQRCSKAVRFGGDEVQPGQPDDNRTRILREYADLVGVLEMLGFTNLVSPTCALRPWIDAKKEKVERFLRYSAECGTLEASRLAAVEGATCQTCQGRGWVPRSETRDFGVMPDGSRLGAGGMWNEPCPDCAKSAAASPGVQTAPPAETPGAQTGRPEPE